jgi:hypothetical protein
MQQLMYEYAIYTPIWQLGFLSGQGFRVEESGLGLIAEYPYSAPYLVGATMAAARDADRNHPFRPAST